MQKKPPGIELCRTAIRMGHETPRGTAEGNHSVALKNIKKKCMVYLHGQLMEVFHTGCRDIPYRLYLGHLK